MSHLHSLRKTRTPRYRCFQRYIGMAASCRVTWSGEKIFVYMGFLSTPKSQGKDEISDVSPLYLGFTTRFGRVLGLVD